MADVKEAFVKIVANGLRLITADWSREYVKIKIQEMIFQVRFGTFNNQKAAFQSQSPQFYSPPPKSLLSEAPLPMRYVDFPGISKINCMFHSSL